MNEEEIRKEGLKGIKEFGIAWQEFFKDKPKPTNDEEDRKQQEEFYHWYNYERKQSDTGKTPAEMYKEAYGKEPPADFPVNADKPSRFMYFDWDEDYIENSGNYFTNSLEFSNGQFLKASNITNKIVHNEDDFDDKEANELDDAEEEAVSIAGDIFEKGWKTIKQEVEGQSKREACKYSYILGFLNYMRMMDMKAERIEKELKDMSKEDIGKLIDKFKEYGEKDE